MQIFWNNRQVWSLNENFKSWSPDENIVSHNSLGHFQSITMFFQLRGSFQKIQLIQCERGISDQSF